ncbi:AvrE-family type 3 secretion system effector [Siccibacter turicensis]|uniref:AvrE-family type 3 secretion system effector n=1 Tax=Siccibacter turicensis TaxID=357233 RepID=UPI003F553C9E
MVIKIPLLAGLSASRKIQAGTQASQSIPLRQLPTRARHNAGGSLSGGAATRPASPPLQQTPAPARQRSGGSMRQSLTRLREKLQRSARSASPAASGSGRAASPARLPGEPRRPASGLPSRPSAPDTTGYARTGAPHRTPDVPSRPSTASPSSVPVASSSASRLDTLTTAADLAMQLYSARTPTDPDASAPPLMSDNARGKQPVRSAAQAPSLDTIEEKKLAEASLSQFNRARSPLAQAPSLDTIEEKKLAEASLSQPSRARTPLAQAPSLETIKEKKFAEASLSQPSRARDPLAQAPSLTTVEEEKYAELSLSQLNRTQQLAFNAAKNDMAEQRNQLRPQIAELALSDRGKLSVTRAVSDNLRNILNETVARPQHTWQAHQANHDSSQHLLMDTHGRLFSLQGEKTAFIGLTQSVPMEGWKQPEPSRLDNVQDKLGVKPLTARSEVQIKLHGTDIATVRAPARRLGDASLQRTVLLPDAAVHAALTGIFAHDREQGDKGAVRETASEHLREHGGRLYRLDERAMRWDQVDENEEKSFSKLTKQADDTLFAIYDKKTLRNLTTGEKSEKFSDKIAGYCTNHRGETLVTLTNEKTNKQSVAFLRRLNDDKSRHVTLALKTRQPDGEIGDFHTRGMTMHDGKVFAIDSNGKLFTGDCPAEDDKQLVLSDASERTAKLAALPGKHFTLESFLNHGTGSLLAIVKDGNDQRHVCALNQQGHFEPQWNLNESLVMDHHEGLIQPRPLPQEMVDLGRLGQLIVYNDKLYALNKNSQRWEATSESVRSLKRGQDGQGWVINDDGQPARVKVSLKSDKIGGLNNQFVMRQQKSSIAVDIPLPGFGPDNPARAIAPVDSERLAAISEKNEIQYHHNRPDSRQPAKMMKTLTKAGIDNYLPHVMPDKMGPVNATGEGNELVDITTDQKQTLYVLDKQGKLYAMPKEDWQAAPGARPGAAWQPVPLPEGMDAIDTLHNVAGGGLMVADTLGRSAILQLAGMRLGANVVDSGERQDATAQENTSAAVTNQNAQQIAPQDRWLIQPEYDPDTKLEAKSHRRRVEKARDRLGEASKSVNVHGMTLKAEVGVMGMTGRDGNHVNSRLRDRLRAHVFDPNLSRPPRPLKLAYRSTVHAWEGREELRPIYQRQATLHQAMKAALAAPPATQLSPLEDRLKALENGPFDRRFLEHLRDFSDSVADSAHHQAMLLGQHAGALKGDGSSDSEFTPPRHRALTQAMNPWSDEDNLVQDLAALHHNYPLRTARPSHALMQSLENQGVVVRHQKAQPPMGRQRDPHDDMGLTKSRLILDGMAMRDLHALVDELETVAAGNPVSFARIDQAQERFRVLRDERYGNDPIQKATSMGFVNNKQLEACYDAIRSMTNAFSKPHHGLNMTTRTVVKASSQEQMTERMMRTIASLESGENMGFGRNYGGMLTLSVIPGGEVIGVPGVRGNLDRAYNASFARSDSGITVSFTRNGGGTGTVFGAVGWNPISQAPDAKNIKVDLGNQRSLTPSARLNGILAMALQRQMQNSVSFTVSEANLKDFLDQLTNGTLDPATLLESGVSHKVKNGTTLTFNVDATMMAMAGGGVNLPTNSADPTRNRAMARATASLQATTNLASAQSEHSVSRTGAGTTLSDSDNRLRMLNSASVGAGVTAGVGVTTGGSKSARIPMFGINSTNIQASIDNRTKQSMSLDIGRADPVDKQQLDKLIKQIESSFDDPKMNALLQEIKDADKPPKNELPPLTPALKALKEQSLRERATSHGTLRPLSAAERKAYEKLKKADEAEAKGDAKGKTAQTDEPPKKEKSSDETFSTFMKTEREAVAMKLEKLLPVLLAITPANNAQYGVLNAARQLEIQKEAATQRTHTLNSAEYQSTYNNLRKIDHNSLMHVVHSLFASELPESNAEAISRFMAEKPMLKEVIRELQKNRNTQASVTLEFTDETRYRMQQKWLKGETQPEEIQAMLKDRSNMRVKSIAFTETDTKQEGFNLPLLLTGASSQANVSITRNLGKIAFSYGEDQRTPNAFTLEGDIADASQDVVNALTRAEVQDKRGVL